MHEFERLSGSPDLSLFLPLPALFELEGLAASPRSGRQRDYWLAHPERCLPVDVARSSSSGWLVRSWLDWHLECEGRTRRLIARSGCRACRVPRALAGIWEDGESPSSERWVARSSSSLSFTPKRNSCPFVFHWSWTPSFIFFFFFWPNEVPRLRADLAGSALPGLESGRRWVARSSRNSRRFSGSHRGCRLRPENRRGRRAPAGTARWFSRSGRDPRSACCPGPETADRTY